MTGSCVLVGCQLVVLLLRVLVYLEARGGWRRRGLEGVALGRLVVHFRGGCTLRGGTLRGVAAGAGTLRDLVGAAVGAAAGRGLVAVLVRRVAGTVVHSVAAVGGGPLRRGSRVVAFCSLRGVPGAWLLRVCLV